MTTSYNLLLQKERRVLIIRKSNKAIIVVARLIEKGLDSRFGPGGHQTIVYYTATLDWPNKESAAIFPSLISQRSRKSLSIDKEKNEVKPTSAYAPGRLIVRILETSNGCHGRTFKIVLLSGHANLLHETLKWP
jgi:hypothetical protein